jgi:ribosomal protein S18 acetylase RimI-like enzyme
MRPPSELRTRRPGRLELPESSEEGGPGLSERMDASPRLALPTLNSLDGHIILLASDPTTLDARETSGYCSALPHPANTLRNPMPIEITDDRARVDVGQLLELYETTWWALNRSAEDVRKALDYSHPVVTAWDGMELVGFTRVLSDRTFRATIWDVIVRPSHQGHGIGKMLVSFVLNHPDLRTVSSFLLLTRDKHAFYERFGFETERDMAMMLRR